MKRWYNIYDLEHALSGQRSANSRTSRQRYLRVFLRRLGLGVGRGSRYEWATESELHSVKEMVKVLVFIKSGGLDVPNCRLRAAGPRATSRRVRHPSC